MLTFEKILKVFQAYLDDDPLYEVVQTSHGYTLMAYPAAFLRNLSAAGRHQQTGGSIPARSCRYGILGAHLLPPAGHGETAGRKADARSAEQPKSVLCCIYEK